MCGLLCRESSSGKLGYTLSTVVFNTISASIMALLPRSAEPKETRYSTSRILCCELLRTLAIFFGLCGASLTSLQCDDEVGLAIGSVAVFLAFTFCRLDDGRKHQTLSDDGYPAGGFLLGCIVFGVFVIGMVMQQFVTKTSMTTRGFIVLLPVLSCVWDAWPFLGNGKSTTTNTKFLCSICVIALIDVAIVVAYVCFLQDCTQASTFQTTREHILGFSICWISSSAIPVLLALSSLCGKNPSRSAGHSSSTIPAAVRGVDNPAFAQARASAPPATRLPLYVWRPQAPVLVA